MTLPRFTRAIGGAIFLALLGVFVRSGYAQQFPADVEMVSFDDQGQMTDASIARLAQIVSGPPPTDLYLVAHGWNNSFEEARDSYRNLMQVMHSVAKRYGIVPTSYRSLVIGVSWPSKAWDDDATARTLSRAPANSDLLTIYRAFPRQKAGLEYERDVQSFQELLSVDPEKLTPEHYRTVSALFKKYSLSGQSADDVGVFERQTNERSLFNSRISIRDALRLFTYWQMKERAGIVGANGVRPLFNQLSSAFPQTKLHLMGHSFGCKLMLSCLGSGSAPARRPNTLVLLQGAVSYQAMNPDGGYSNVAERVDGPVIATYSENDGVLGIPYELASRLAGQTAERRAVSVYSALGRVGAENIESREIVGAVPTDSYRFGRGLANVHGGVYITGHSDFVNDAVARMLWSAVFAAPLSTTPPAARALVTVPATGGRSLPVAGPTPLSRLSRARSTPTATQLQQAALAADAYAKSLAEHDNSLYLQYFRAAFNATVEGRLTPLSGERSLHARSMPSFPEISMAAAPIGISADSTYQANARRLATEAGENHPRPRIIGGLPTTDFPDCVAVGPDGDWCCTGTLVAPNVVITAGHCFGECTSRIYVGSNVAVPGRINAVKTAVQHPQYHQRGQHNDLTVLILDEDVPGVAPRRIAPSDKFASAFFVRAVGFGTTNTAGTLGYGRKRVVDVPIASIDSSGAGIAPRYGSDAGLELVAGSPFLDRDTCNGDSGGPVYIEIDGDWYLAGATSRATSDATRNCGDGGIYVRVDKYLDWIKSVPGGHWPP
jgi:Trypsin